MKVAYNSCYGGFNLSQAAVEYLHNKGVNVDNIHRAIFEYEWERHDPFLIEAIETLGDAANGDCSKLKIANIPDEYGTYYTISEYDGMESVVCDFKRLIRAKLSTFDIDSATEETCKNILKDIKRLSKDAR